MYEFNLKTLMKFTSSASLKFEFEREERYNQMLEQEKKNQKEALIVKGFENQVSKEKAKALPEKKNKAKDLDKITLAATVFTLTR